MTQTAELSRQELDDIRACAAVAGRLGWTAVQQLLDEIDRLHADRAAAQQVVLSLAARVVAQSELLTRAASRANAVAVVARIGRLAKEGLAPRSQPVRWLRAIRLEVSRALREAASA